MKAGILTIGDEILIGQVINTNASFIGKELTKIGVEVEQIRTVRDIHKDIVSAMKEMSATNDLILITGGLGPTKDDVTKLALCAYFDDSLIESLETLDNIKALFSRIEEPMLPVHLHQAKVPSKAKVLKNKYGTAPGMWCEKDGVVYVSMPGVPFEMKALLRDEVIPELAKRFDRHFIIQKTILTHGMGESRVAARIADWENALPDSMGLAYLPAPGRVRLRLTAKGTDEDFLQKEMNKQLDKLRALISDIFGGYEGEGSLQEEIARMLTEKGKTLATAESCTGGRLAELFTSIPGASAYFRGGMVSYATSVKIDALGVPAQTIEEYSVVSAQTAVAMAERARAMFKSDYAVGTTGNAGPTKGDSDAEIGTVFLALADGVKTEVRKFHLGNIREKVVGKAVVRALEMLKENLGRA